MFKKEKLIQSTVIAFLTLANSNSLMAADEAKTCSTEKCYGLVKAGMNDCNTAKSSCAGSATKDKQPDAYVLMPPGLCNKLVGGNLKPGKPKE